MPYDPYQDPYGGQGSLTSGYSDYKKQQPYSYGFQWLSDDPFSQLMRDAGGGTGFHPDMDEDTYNSMSPEEWAQFRKMNDSQQTAFIVQRKRDIASGKVEVAANKDLESKRAAREGQQEALIKKVQAFADEMGMPIAKLMQRDDFAKALNNVTYQNSMGNAMNTGAGGGGLSQANADQATKNALLGYQFQRQQAGQNALSGAFNMIGNQMQDAEGLRRYNQGMNLQMQEANAMRQAQQYQQGLGRQQSTFGLIGGIAGGALGAYAGGPTGAAAGFQAGQGLGSALGGATYGSYQPYKYRYPSGSGGGKGGLGGNY